MRSAAPVLIALSLVACTGRPESAPPSDLRSAIASDREARTEALRDFLNYRSPNTEGTLEDYLRDRFHRECKEVRPGKVVFFLSNASMRDGQHEVMASWTNSGVKKCALPIAFAVGSVTESGEVLPDHITPQERVGWLSDFIEGRGA